MCPQSPNRSLTRRWRDAALSRSNDLSERVLSLLSGHQPDGAPLQVPHVAYAPLAFVAHEHADGHLIGIALAVPHDLPREDRRELMVALNRVREIKLGPLGVWRVAPVVESFPPVNLRPETWTAYPEGATRWATVTPIVFDVHPKTKEKSAYHEDVAAMIARACVRVGLPSPTEMIVTAVSAHLGASPSHEFPLLARKDGSKRQQTHAILVFDVPVTGPILLGAGRYRGYGLCRPINQLHRRGGSR